MNFGRLNIFSSRCISLPLIVTAFVLLLFVPLVNAQMDLPNPPANLETIPAGSFIIPMDTINQAIVPPGDAPFNLKAYGLINRFLQNGIPVKWAIRAGKAKDAIDFTALASRIFPTALPAANVDFISGPFILPDTVLPCGLTSSQVIQLFGNNVAVYQLQQSVVVDVRYRLEHRPKIAVFNNGGNQLIHQKILDAAGIPDYIVLSAAQISTLGDCFTFASEPHADSMQVTAQMVNGIAQFVQNGGNFLAQCLAVESYESRGFFQTTTGLNIVNTQIANNYMNSDMAAAQIHGGLFPNRYGSCTNWSLNPGSAWRPYYYPMVSDISTDSVAFTAAHLIAPTAIGGNMFFLGGHDYGRTQNGGAGGAGPGLPVASLTDLDRVNGMRYYLNAVMIPSYILNAAWANAGPDPTLNCGDSIALGCSQTGPLTASYSWSPATGLSCLTCPNPMANPTSTTTYIVTVGTTCDATDTVTVFVNSTPSVNVNSASICTGDSVTLNATGANAYAWTPSIGLSLNTGSTVVANPSVTTIYTVTGTTQAGCTGSFSATVTVNPHPVIVVNSPSICNGDSSILTANGGVSYSWLPSASLINASNNTATVQPNITSNYTVTGTDANGCSSSALSTVTVNDSVSITANPATICFGAFANLNVTGTPAGNIYSWSNGSSGSSISVSPSADSTYSVTGTSTNGCSATISVAVHVNPLPIIASNDTAVCTGSAAVLHAQGGQSYSWTGGGQTYTGATITISPATTTIYTVTGTDANTCVNTSSGTVTVNPLPIITSTNDTICNGETGSLQAVGGVTYNWQPGNLNGATISVSPLSTTTYNVVSTDALGCTNSANGIIIVNSNPLITATNDSICVGDFGTVTAFGAAAFLWLSGNLGSTFTDNPLSTTTYSVTGTSSAGCTGNAFATIVVSPKPVINFDVGPSGCAPLEVSFQNLTQGNGLVFTWAFGDGTYSNDVSPSSHVYTNPGIYSVNLNVNNNGCIVSATSPKMVSAYPNPIANFTIDEVVQDVIQSQVQLHNTSSGEVIRDWYFGDGSFDNTGAANPFHVYSDTGMFTICLSVRNDHGCADSICNDIEIKPSWAFFIANAFTPNDDHKNEGFIGKSYNVIEHEMWIYDRWGLMIYDTGKTPNPETAEAWDGTIKGGDTPVQEDVYVWRVRLKDINDKYHDLIGHVTVVK